MITEDAWAGSALSCPFIDKEMKPKCFHCVLKVNQDAGVRTDEAFADFCAEFFPLYL